MNITFTDKVAARLGRGVKRSILFVKAGDTYETPDEGEFTHGEEEQLKMWLSEGWAVETGKKTTIRKGAKGTGPVSKSEVKAPPGTPEEV